MSVLDLFEELLPKEGATSEQLDTAQVECGVVFPDDYRMVMSLSNGVDGFIGGHYLRMWPLEKLFRINEGNGARGYLGALFLFGSDGGGELFGWDMRDGLPWKIVIISNLGDLRHAKVLGHSISEFLEFLASGQDLFS